MLEYWEDKEETRAALQNAEDERAERMEALTKQKSDLEAQHLAARDLADSGRAAFDAKMDAVALQIEAASRRARQWERRSCENASPICASTRSRRRSHCLARSRCSRAAP